MIYFLILREAYIKKKEMTFVILGGGVKNIKNVIFFVKRLGLGG